MTSETIRIQNENGTVVFGREGYVLADLDTGAAFLAGAETAGRDVSFSGYILPDGADAAARAVQMETLARRVRRIVCAAGGFTLSVGGRSIVLSAKRAPVFAHEAPLNGDEACFFTVYAAAKDASSAYFFGALDDLAVGRGWQGALVFPLSITERTVFATAVSEGSFVAHNTGDVPCGFTATVRAMTGDVDSFVLRRADGAQISFSHPIAEGESVVIDTRTGKKSVTANGESILPSISADSVFFALVPGENRLDWACTGTGTVVVSLALTPLYH